MGINLNMNIKYNSIIFIESLNSKENHYTQEIYKKEVKPHCKKNNISCNYFHIKNKGQFITLLDNICNHHQKIFPIIHIACHGTDKEIELLESFVKWSEFESQILKINQNSENNLYLIMAMCMGAHSIDFYSNTERAPFYFMIGPQNQPKGYYLDKHLKHFYKKLFETNNTLKAVQYIKTKNTDKKIPFLISTCFDMYFKTIDLYRKSIKNGSIRHELYDNLKKMNGGNIPYDLKSKIQYPEQIETLHKKVIKDFRNKFFMIDLYPENSDRFKSIENY